MLRNHKVSLSFVALYTVITAALMSPVATTGLRNSTVWPEGDASLPIWAYGYVSHLSQWFSGGAPFYTDSIYHPHGLNLLANTTSFGLAVMLIPVTWLIGPIGSFNLTMLLCPVLSATAMMWSLKRVIPSPYARGVAGLVWGFSPFIMEAFYWGWPNFLFLVAPPLIFWALVELFHNDIPSRRLGMFAGVMLAVQITIGGEVAAMSTVGVIVVAILVGLPYVAIRRRLPNDVSWSRLTTTLMWSIIGFVPLGVPVALFAALGPAHLDKWVWSEGFMKAGFNWSPLVNTPIVRGSLGYWWYPVMPNHFFMGWPLLIVGGLAILLLRHSVARTVAVVGLVGLWFMRGGAAYFNPLRILWALPVVRNIVPGRFIMLTWFAIAVLTAFAVANVTAFLKKRNWNPRVRVSLIVVSLCAVFYQPAHAVIFAGPWHTQSPRHDPALTVYGKSLTSTKVVMVYPVWKSAASMIQQVTEPLHIKLIGGWGPQPGYSTQEIDGAIYLLKANNGLLPIPTNTQLVDVNRFVNLRHVDSILIPRHYSFEKERGYIQPYQISAVLTYLYGPPKELLNAWLWEKPSNGAWHRYANFTTITEKQWQRCAWGVGNVNPRGVPLCIIKAQERRALPR